MFLSNLFKSTPSPEGWPSDTRIKCSDPKCRYPNSLQTTAGSYHCEGDRNGFACHGIYNVSAYHAREMRKHYQQLLAQEEEELKRRKNEEKRRKSMERHALTAWDDQIRFDGSVKRGGGGYVCVRGNGSGKKGRSEASQIRQDQRLNRIAGSESRDGKRRGFWEDGKNRRLDPLRRAPEKWI